MNSGVGGRGLCALFYTKKCGKSTSKRESRKIHDPDAEHHGNTTYTTTAKTDRGCVFLRI